MAKLAWTDETVINTQKLSAAYDAKIIELKNACTEAIYNGFKSSATGFEFGFNELDQTNFTQQLLLIVSVGGPANYTGTIEWKTKAGTVENITAAKFVEIVTEAEEHKRAQQRKYWALEIQVKAASTVEDIAVIKW